MNQESVVRADAEAYGSGVFTWASILLVYINIFADFIDDIESLILVLSVKKVFIWELVEFNNFEMFPTWFLIWVNPPQFLLSPFRATSRAPYNPHFVFFKWVWATGIIVKAAMDVAKIATENMMANRATHLI